MKIRPVGAELFNAQRRTDNHDDANSLLPPPPSVSSLVAYSGVGEVDSRFS